jgi:hypothetical protein
VKYFIQDKQIYDTTESMIGNAYLFDDEIEVQTIMRIARRMAHQLGEPLPYSFDKNYVERLRAWFINEMCLI